MKVRDFNELKREVRKGDVKRLKEAIGELTLKQAQAIEDLMYDLTLNEEMNKVLDELVTYIDSLTATEKVANKKALKVEKEPEKVEPEPEPVKTEVQVPDKPAKNKPFNRVKVGDVIQVQVEGEEVKNSLLIVYKGKNNLVAVMEDNEEVFKIRRVDFNKLAFQWTDRKGETYNITVTL